MAWTLQPLAAGGDLGIVLDLLILLGAAAFAMLVLGRLGISAIPAMILTGAVIGPKALGLVPDPEALSSIAHLAIVMLLFGVGLELHLDALHPGALRLLGAGIGSVLGTTLLLWPLANLLAGNTYVALAMAMAFSLSSTAAVLKFLAARRELTQPSGRLGLAILVVQDIAVIGMIAMVPVLAGWADVTPAEVIAVAEKPAMLLRIGGVAALLIAGRFILPPVLREALRIGGTEMLFLVGMAFAFGAAAACAALGFSVELGAFLAGFLLADTPFQDELSAQVAPVRDLFLAVFFTSLGMRVDLATAVQVWPLLLACLAVLLLVKGLATSIACWTAGAHASTALVVGAYLAHGGEFSLVFLDQVRAYGLIDETMHSTLIVLVVGGLLLLPVLGALARRAAPALAGAPLAPRPGQTQLTRPYEPAAADSGPINKVIVAGWGPVGQAVADGLTKAGVTVSVVDWNARSVEALRKEGRRAVLGDVRRESVLRSAGLMQARGLVLTVPDGDVAERATALARRLRPDLWIAARFPFVASKTRVDAAGADLAVSDEDAVAGHLAACVLEALQPAE